MAYTPPSVKVTSIANNRIINISDDVRIPAIVGPGPTTRTITDTPIARGSANYDLLPTSGSAVTITKVASYPGASATDTRWSLNGAGVQKYYNTSGSTGSVYWSTSVVAGTNKPLLGETYYLSYTYPVPSTQYDPQLFVDSSDVRAFYGGETTLGIGTTGVGALTMGANLALENGAPAVICLQTNGTLTSATTWSDAFAKLKKKDNIGYLVPLASGSSIKTVAHSAAILHVNQESAPSIGHEQSAILGAYNVMTVENIVTATTAIDDNRVIYLVPGTSVTRTLSDGTVVPIDGAWIAAALAGLLTSQEKVITPVTGKVITGFTIPDNQYEPYNMNRMAVNGACIIAARSGVSKIRHALTTDPTSADTSEISVVAADDLVRRITRTKLTDRFVGKGVVIDDSTMAAVESTIASIWGAMKRERLISNYGTKTDPTTGEVPISANRDAAEPTKINVTGAIQFLYPLNYINVEFFIYV